MLQTTQPPEQPVVVELVYCPHCGYNITDIFNKNRRAVFTVEQKEHLARVTKATAKPWRTPPAGTVKAIRGYERGEKTQFFWFKCGDVTCQQKLEFCMHNTFTGETKMKDGTPLLIVHPNTKEKSSDF